MKVSFTINNVRELKSLFKTKSTFIDAFVGEDVVILFSDSQDMFVYTHYKIGYCDSSDPGVSFRIPRDGFLNLVDDGVISLMFEEGTVYLKVDNGVTNHTMKFSQQSCNVVGMLDKISLIEDCENYAKVKLTDLLLISKLSRNSPSPIMIEDGIAFISLDSLMIFSRTKCCDMALFPAMLSQLLSVCEDESKVYSIENFVAYVGDNYGIAITKALSVGGSDYNFVKRQKELEGVEVDFSAASSLISRVRKYDSVEFDLNDKTLSLREAETEYSTPILVKDLMGGVEGDIAFDLESVMSGSYLKQFPKVEFPENVFRQIMYLSKAKILKISFTNSLVRMKISDSTLLVCRR